MGTNDLYVDGAWRPAADGATRDIVSPATGTSGDDRERGRRGGRGGGGDRGPRGVRPRPWPQTGSLERAALLHRVADLLERDTEAYAQAESGDTGKRLVESRYDLADVRGGVPPLRRAREHRGRSGPWTWGRADVVSRVVHEAVGVCALITP